MVAEAICHVQGTRAASEGSDNEDGATQPKKPRRTASSLSAKEAKELQAQRETVHPCSNCLCWPRLCMQK